MSQILTMEWVNGALRHVGHNMKGNRGFLEGWQSIVIDTLDCQFNSGGGQGIRPKAIQHMQGFEGRQINLEGSTCYVRHQKSDSNTI